VINTGVDKGNEGVIMSSMYRKMLTKIKKANIPLPQSLTSKSKVQIKLQNLSNQELTDTLTNLLLQSDLNLNLDPELFYIKDKYHSEYYFIQNAQLDPK
jgi:hypothetical protein